MKHDESGAAITQALSGRIIDYVVRRGRKIQLVCFDGHVVTLQADENGEIQYLNTGVSIVLPGVSMRSKAGRVGG